MNCKETGRDLEEQSLVPDLDVITQSCLHFRKIIVQIRGILNTEKESK